MACDGSAVVSAASSSLTRYTLNSLWQTRRGSPAVTRSPPHGCARPSNALSGFLTSSWWRRSVQPLSTNYALRRAGAPLDLWGEIDPSLLESGREDIPVFPVHVLPTAWAQWVSDTAESTGAPIDYVAQGLLASVAAVTGAGIEAEVNLGWREPVVLWSALVGVPSSGKSPALAAARRLIEPIELEQARSRRTTAAGARYQGRASPAARGQMERRMRRSARARIAGPSEARGSGLRR